jgi:two-component system sensor kinase FixL
MFGKPIAARTAKLICFRRENVPAPTERREMEELKDRYEIIAEAASDAIVTVDEQGKILSISRAAERIFGYSVPEMVGQQLEWIIPDYRKYLGEIRQKGKTASAVELPGVHKTGSQIQLELSLGEYKKNNKHIYTGIIRDIAPRKNTDRRLAAQFAVTRALAESSSLGEAVAVCMRSARLGAR